jgi:hypothetical protein
MDTARHDRWSDVMVGGSGAILTGPVPGFRMRRITFLQNTHFGFRAILEIANLDVAGFKTHKGGANRERA